MEELPVIKKRKKRIKIMTPTQVVNKQRVIYDFKGKFLQSFGKPERHAKWFITGPPYSGKSSFLFEICNMLTEFGKVDYNNHEEAGGDSQTVAMKLEQSGATDNINLRLYKAPIESDELETFSERLSKRNSADFAILDSIQHAQLTKKLYISLTDKFCNSKRGKSMLFISHWAKNDFTLFVKHDCDIKIEVIGFVARIESRYGGGNVFVIWEKGAKNYWGKNYSKVIAGKYWPGKKK
jgi:hypothetical protein